jgi:hypothetical protein
MGKLVFDIGTTTAIRNVGNVQAEKILNDFIELNEGPITGTLQEKLDWAVAWLLTAMRQAHIEAIRRREYAALDAALAAKFENWSG